MASRVLAKFDLSGQRALVTGAGRGIGQACAVALAEAGASVAVHTRQSDPSATLERISAAGQRGISVKADLTDRSELADLVDTVVKGLGAVDILVNNAGANARRPCEDFPEEDWDRILATNLDAVWLLSQRLGRRMLERGSGKIINIASMLSFSGGINIPAYAASKHAVAGITKALANEWAGRGVNVNAIAPGYIETEMSKDLKADPVRNRQLVERIPAGDWGKPEDLKGAVVFLASPAARYVHGHVLAVDGGFLGR